MFRKIVCMLVIISFLGCEFGDPSLVEEAKESVSESESSSHYATVQAPIYIGFDYNLTSSWGYKYVSGCIKQNLNRLAVRLNKGSNQVFDMHAAGYTYGGKMCFGLYESVSKWTRCTCSPTKDQVTQFFYEAALAVGVAASVAWAAAKVAAPMMLPILAL